VSAEGAGAELRIVRLRPDLPLPSAAYADDAGLDLVAAERAVLPPGGRAAVPCGIAIELPPGHCGLVLPRSGLAERNGVTLLNAPGLVDAGYRGELRVILHNTDLSEPFTVEPGMRIAQLVVAALPVVTVVEADELGGSERGPRGFGSSGVAALPGR
jgi:dUTP pyrophosphatase